MQPQSPQYNGFAVTFCCDVERGVPDLKTAASRGRDRANAAAPIHGFAH